MGKLLSVLGRSGEPNNVNDQEVALPPPDAALPVVSDSNDDDDLFKTMGHGTDEQGRPYFTVNGVPCFTRSQLDEELRKDECKRQERVIQQIDNEGKPPQPGLPQSPDDMRIAELQNEIGKHKEECKRMRECTDKLLEAKVELFQMERKHGALESLGNVHSNRPIVTKQHMDSCPHFKGAKTVRGQVINDKIGEQLKEYHQAETSRKLEEGSRYYYLITMKNTAGLTQCETELLGHKDTAQNEVVPSQIPIRASSQDPHKLPGSVPKRAITRK